MLGSQATGFFYVFLPFNKHMDDDGIDPEGFSSETHFQLEVRAASKLLD